VSDFLKIIRLSPALFVVACAAPKAIVVEETKKKQEETKQEVAPVMPALTEADQLRAPDLLNKLPDKAEFQATNPKASAGRSDGAPVIAHPPSDQPPSGR